MQPEARVYTSSEQLLSCLQLKRQATRIPVRDAELTKNAVMPL